MNCYLKIIFLKGNIGLATAGLAGLVAMPVLSPDHLQTYLSQASLLHILRLPVSSTSSTIRPLQTGL